MASGVNGDEAQSVMFWHAWMAQEIPFFDRDQPWERADVIVAGASTARADTQYIEVARHCGVRPVRDRGPRIIS